MENPHSILKKVFGYDSFRPGQEEIVNAIPGHPPHRTGRHACLPVYDPVRPEASAP